MDIRQDYDIDDNEITVCQLDATESAQWAASLEARTDVEVAMHHALASRGIESAVYLWASDGTELDYLEPA